MARFAEFTKVNNARRPGGYQDDDFGGTDDVNEPQQARESGAEQHADDPASRKLVINIDTIRCFYPRHEGKPGTRITFVDGGGFPVEEDYATVKGQVMPN